MAGTFLVDGSLVGALYTDGRHHVDANQQYTCPQSPAPNQVGAILSILGVGIGSVCSVTRRDRNAIINTGNLSPSSKGSLIDFFDIFVLFEIMYLFGETFAIVVYNSAALSDLS